MSNDRYRKARGFSLSEILLVLVIIAILSGMIMLRVGTGEDKAKATRLAGDLDALRSAVLAYSTEESWNPNAFDASEAQDAKRVKVASISRYIDRSIDKFVVIKSGDRLLVGFEDSPKVTGGVASKLASMAKDAGLRDQDGGQYTTGSSVYMFVR